MIEKLAEGIEREIGALFRAAKEEFFEDSIESDFSKKLGLLIRKYADIAVAVLVPVILTEQVNEEIAHEALRILGRLEHPQTHLDRRALLERSLYCLSPWIRDGAALGLATLKDPHAIRYLKQAIDRERIEELRKDVETILAELESIVSVADI